MARPHTLDVNPELLDPFVNMLVEGVNRDQIAEALGINKSTVTEWKKRPDVQRKWGKAVEERANRILSQTDRRIEAQLIERGGDMSVDQLLRIRQTFAGERVTISGDGDAGEALTKLIEAAHADPDLAAALDRVMPDGD